MKYTSVESTTGEEVMMTPKERLLLLADKLEADANNPKGIKFDLYQWFGDETKEMICNGGVPILDCGTVGCAIGLAMLTPEFNKEGFGTSKFQTPEFNKKVQWDAVEEYFGLSHRKALKLFYDLEYPRNLRKGADAERAVTKRIREHTATM